MAFVFRSELKSCFENKTNPQIGPGYYHQEVNQLNNKSPNKIPFLNSSPKILPKKFSEIPGPGAYYNDEQFRKISKNKNNFNPIINLNFSKEQKKIFNNNLNSNNINSEVIYRALENENIINDSDPIHLFIDDHFEKLGFLSKDKRFKDFKNVDIPGPGAYAREKSKSARILTNKNDKEKLKKLFLASLNKQKIESIPAKNNAFGYDYDEYGNLVKNEDPLRDKKFNGNKIDSVGPGNYEIVKDKDWVKKGTLAWSKNPSHTQNNFFKRDIKKNNNNLDKNRSISPESKSNIIFNKTGIMFNNNNKYLNTTDNFNNNIIDDSVVKAEKFNENNKQNFHSKTFYALTRQKKMRNFTSSKNKIMSATMRLKKKYDIDPEINNNSINTFENEHIYNTKNFQHFKSLKKRFSHSFEIEKKEIPELRTETDQMLKFFKDKNKRRKEILLMNHTNKLFDRGYLLKNKQIDNNPGPGYYLEECMYTSFKPQPLPEERQIFGSISQRFPYLKTADTMGPGSYFREDLKIEKNKQKSIKEKIMIPQLNKLKSCKKPIKVEHNILPGPGDYRPEKPKKRIMTANTTANFGSKEPRFKKNTEIIPGPGSYKNADYWVNKGDNKNEGNGLNSFAKILIKPNSANPHRNFEKMQRLLQNENEDSTNDIFNNTNAIANKNHNRKGRIQIVKTDTPGVGAYNADAVYSLEYKVAKNCSKYSLVEAPFNSTKTRPRFDEMRHNSPTIIGPGYYHKNETRKFKQINPPFKNTEKRFRESKSQYRTNPGQYDPESYFGDSRCSS